MNNNFIINYKLSNYIGYDIDAILFGTESVVFGGALRDIVSGEKTVLNDVDILTFPISRDKIRLMLIMIGFIELNEYIKLSTMDMYTHSAINFPITLIKNNKKIQLVTPRGKPMSDNGGLLQLDLLGIASQVDLSCCGLIYNPVFGLNETVNGAIDHCKKKCFKILKDNKFYFKERTLHRSCKLLDRGWKEIY